MRKAYWAHASYYLFWGQRLGAAQEKEATPEWRSPLALRTREVCKIASSEACRYHITENYWRLLFVARQPQPYVTHLVGQKVRPPGGLEINSVFGCVLSISHCYLHA